jgi:hypothetical protein
VFSSPATTNDSGSGGLATGAKAGIGVGVAVAAVALISAIAFFFYRRGKVAGGSGSGASAGVAHSIGNGNDNAGGLPELGAGGGMAKKVTGTAAGVAEIGPSDKPVVELGGRPMVEMDATGRWYPHQHAAELAAEPMTGYAGHRR